MIQVDYLDLNNMSLNVLKPPLNGQWCGCLADVLFDKIYVKHVLIAVDLVYIPQICRCLTRPE